MKFVLTLNLNFYFEYAQFVIMKNHKMTIMRMEFQQKSWTEKTSF